SFWRDAPRSARSTPSLPDALPIWRGRRWREETPPDRLAGKTMAIVGLGDIGRTIAAAAGALGLRVIGVSRSGRPVREVDRVYRLDRKSTRLNSSHVKTTYAAFCLK